MFSALAEANPKDEALTAQLPLGADGGRASVTARRTRMAYDDNICPSGEPLGAPTCTTKVNSSQAESRAESSNSGICALQPKGTCCFGPDSLFDGYLQLRDVLRRFLFRLVRDDALAEEALQETAIVAGQKCFDELPTSMSPQAWLYGVSRNQGLAALRRRGVVDEAPDEDTCSALFGTCLGAEPEQHEEVFIARDLEGRRRAFLRAVLRDDYDDAIAYLERVENGGEPITDAERAEQLRRMRRLRRAAGDGE